jgi:ribosomal protein L27
MKYALLITILAASAFMACKSKKATGTTSDSNDAQFKSLQAKVPETSVAELKTGHELFNGKCTNCHAAKNVTTYKEDDLKRIVNVMSGKAYLNDSEKQAVWMYALAVNRSGKGS